MSPLAIALCEEEKVTPECNKAGRTQNKPEQLHVPAGGERGEGRKHPAVGLRPALPFEFERPLHHFVSTCPQRRLLIIKTLGEMGIIG